MFAILLMHGLLDKYAGGLNSISRLDIVEAQDVGTQFCNNFTL